MGKAEGMKKQLKQIGGIVLCALLVVCSSCAKKRDITSYTYEYTRNELAEMQDNHEELFAALSVPDDILKRLTNEALIQALFQHPYLNELRMSSIAGNEFGMNEVVEFARCYNVMQEILERKEELKDVFLSYGIDWMNELAERSGEDYSEEERDRMNWSPFTAQEVFSGLVHVLYPDVEIIRAPENIFEAGSFRFQYVE